MGTQSFTASSTWTAPSGVTSVTVECWGGGGAGGSAQNSGSVGGGGAGGAYAKKVVTVSPSTVYTVTVGATQTTSGSAGNDSWFSTSGTVIAKGGAGGGNATGGAAGAGGTGTTTGSIGDTTFAGGNGATGTASTNGGGGGGGAGSTGAGGNATGSTGGTGKTLNGGNGGNGATTSGANGGAGSVYGGAGGGGRANNNTTRTGGSGAAGYVVLTWIDPVTTTKTQSATARIYTTATKGQSSAARIQTSAQRTQPSTATLKLTASRTQPATAKIVAVYDYSRVITVTSDSSKLPSTQTSFPVLVSVTDSSFRTVSNGGNINNTATALSGPPVTMPCDLVFSTTLSSSSGMIPWEIEHYNPSTGQLIAWVNLPSCSLGATFYVLYGNQYATVPQNTGSLSPASVWSSSYSSVYHFADGTTLRLQDSSSSSNTITTNVGCTAGTGKIDGGVVVGASHRLETAYLSAYDASSCTQSVWFKATSNSDYQMLLHRDPYSGTRNTQFRIRNDNYLEAILVFGGLSFLSSSSTVTDGNWHLATLVLDYSGSSTAGRLYLDGALQASGSASGAQPTGTNPLSIGADYSSNSALNGSIDEVHMASVARSANWITAEYASQNSPSTFLDVGPEVSRSTRQSQASTARITSSLSRNQLSTARIRVTTERTQASIAKISSATVTTTKTIQAVARIKATAGRTQLSGAAIRATATRSQTAVSRIRATATATQTAVSRIHATVTRTQPSVARLSQATTKTQAAIARIRVTSSRTQTATADILATRLQTQPSAARVAVTAQASQPAQARLQRVVSATQTATGSIQATLNAYQLAVASIRNRTVRTQTASARLRKLWTDTDVTSATWATEIPSTGATWTAVPENTTTWTSEV